MAAGGAIALFAFPLFPGSAKDFVESGQAKILDWKEDLVKDQGADEIGRIALEAYCEDATKWEVRKAPNGLRYWSCQNDTQTSYYGVEERMAGQYGSIVCTSHASASWRVQLPSGQQVSQTIEINRCESGIDPEEAVSLVMEYVNKLNKGDEAGLRKILTPEIFVETRNILLSYRDIEFEIQVLDIEAPSTCLDTCDVSIKVIGSGNVTAPSAIIFAFSGGFEEGTSVFSIGEVDGETLITGIN